VERIKNLGMSACAITDHGNLSGAIDFYKACKKAGIKPILGCEVYCTMDKDGLPNEEKTRDNRHLVLLAMNSVGWRNLIWLNNRAHLHNFYYNPRVALENLLERNDGLIATTACLGGVIAKKQLVEGDTVVQNGGIYNEMDKTFTDGGNVGIRWLAKLHSHFKDRLYIEVQDQPNWEQEAFNKWAMRIAEELNIQTTLACDAHYPKEEDVESHDLLMAQQYKMLLSDYKSKNKFSVKNWVREPDELYKAAMDHNLGEAFWNTRDIAARCEVEIQLGKYQTPQFDITKCEDYQEFLACQT